MCVRTHLPHAAHRLDADRVAHLSGGKRVVSSQWSVATGKTIGHPRRRAPVESACGYSTGRMTHGHTHVVASTVGVAHLRALPLHLQGQRQCNRRRSRCLARAVNGRATPWECVEATRATRRAPRRHQSRAGARPRWAL
eukprot:scaffold3205_cov62-Phaeocystis_antarctica.AAC.4